MSRPLTIVVTGSNRGIGQGIIQLLAKTQHPRPLTIYATSRSGANLHIQASQSNEIRYSKLDVTDKESISSFLQTAGRPIDILINNAGINNTNRETPTLAAQCIDVNYAGTRDMCQAFLEEGNMARTPGSRIVNVSSTACQLNNYTAQRQEAFRCVTSISHVDALADDYVSAVQRGQQDEGGWGTGPTSYLVSKALINALTSVLAHQFPHVLVNCCCPGWVDTDMGLQVGRPPKSLEEGARIPVRLALGQLGPGGDGDGGLGQETESVSGKYFGNDGLGERGWGRVRGW